MEHEKWYTGEASELVRTGDHTVVDCHCTGKGDISVYDLFPGIYLYFMDMDTPDILHTVGFPDHMIEITYCRKGTCECRIQNHQNEYLAEGYVSIAGIQFMPYEFLFPEQVYDGFSIVLDLDRIPPSVYQVMSVFGVAFNQIPQSLESDIKRFVSPAGDPLTKTFEAIYKGKEHEDLDYLRMKVMEALYHVERVERELQKNSLGFNPEHVRITKSIKHYLTTHLTDNISIERMTSEAGIHPNRFYLIFKNLYGESPYSYLKKYRMGVAAARLETEDTKIGQIAKELGYSNASKFSKAFESVYGVLPSAYRKNKS